MRKLAVDGGLRWAKRRGTEVMMDRDRFYLTASLQPAGWTLWTLAGPAAGKKKAKAGCKLPRQTRHRSSGTSVTTQEAVRTELGPDSPSST